MEVKYLSAEAWITHPGAFVALWTDSSYAYALYEPGELVAVALHEGAYPALAHKAAHWFQRLAKDLNGHVATGFEDPRPATAQFRTPDGRAPWPEFSGPEEDGVNQLALGPVYGALTEPVHFRAFVQGERILKLQTRLGYAHRGLLGLMRGKSPRQAARYAARVTGDATVAHSLAFARAAESALGCEIPPRALGLRAVMAGVEQLAGHCGALAESAAALGDILMQSRWAVLREYFCAAAHVAFGHRLMMDLVVPGGVAVDITEAGVDVVQDSLQALEAELPALQRRFAAPVVQELLTGLGAIGQLIKDRLASLSGLVGQVRDDLAALVAGPVAVILPHEAGMGVGRAESFRGPVWVWLVLANGQIQDVFVADACCQLWPMLETGAVGTTLAQSPIMLAGLALSCAAVDL